jgi:hypothetical protein
VIAIGSLFLRKGGVEAFFQFGVSATTLLYFLLREMGLLGFALNGEWRKQYVFWLMYILNVISYPKGGYGITFLLVREGWVMVDGVWWETLMRCVEGRIG